MATAGTVKAVVVRGTFMKIGDDGARIPVVPGKGKDSEVDVTEAVLFASVGVLVRAENAAAEVQKAAAETMAPATDTNQAIVAPTPAAQQAAAQQQAAAGQRRTR